MGIRRYVLRRILEMIPVIFVVLTLNFLLIHLAPGDPALVMAGETVYDPEYIELTRQKWGLDKPLYEQYLIFMSKILTGDLGYDYLYSLPVSTIILQYLPRTLLLVISSLALGITIGTLLGAYSVKRLHSKRDTIVSALGLTLNSIPPFWFALIAILVFAIWIPLFPPYGFLNPMVKDGVARIFDMLYHLVLPLATLTLTSCIPVYLRISRASMSETLGEDYITTARCVGLPENTVFLKHALRNALLPIVTMAGIQLSFIFSGSLLVEAVFRYEGLGMLMYSSILRRDYSVLMGIFFIMSICVVVFGFVTDIIYAYLDPRIRY